MSDVQEISEDYDHDSDLSITFDEAFGDDIDTLNSDVKEANALDQELDQLLHSMVAVEQFGMNPSSFGVLKASGLLAGTSIEVLAMENFRTARRDDPESLMAIESLGDKVKSKMIAWSVRIVAFVKTICTKTLSILSGMWDKIAEASKILGMKSWDAAKSAGRSIKAHPFRTVIAAITAAAAVAAIIVFVTTGMPAAAASEEVMTGFVLKSKAMIDKINWSFGKITTSISSNGAKLAVRIEPTIVELRESSATALGWSVSAVKSSTSHVRETWSFIKSGVTSMGTKVAGLVARVSDIADPGEHAHRIVSEKTGSKFAGWISKQVANKFLVNVVWGVVGVIATLLKDIVYKALQVVAETFRALMPMAAKTEATA